MLFTRSVLCWWILWFTVTVNLSFRQLGLHTVGLTAVVVKVRVAVVKQVLPAPCRYWHVSLSEGCTKVHSRMSHPYVSVRGGTVRCVHWWHTKINLGSHPGLNKLFPPLSKIYFFLPTKICSSWSSTCVLVVNMATLYSVMWWRKSYQPPTDDFCRSSMYEIIHLKVSPAGTTLFKWYVSLYALDENDTFTIASWILGIWKQTSV